MQQTRVIETKKDLLDIKQKLLSEIKGLDEKKVPNAKWQLACTSGVVTAYKTGKIVIQSKESDWLENVSRILHQFSEEGKTKGDTTESFIPHIGIDEAGKGDYFGPMVISAVFVANSKDAEKLMKLGVRDSKKISDRRAIELREHILKVCKHVSEVVISPQKYNELYLKIRNVNKLLAWGHARSLENILEKLSSGECKHVVIDQFSRNESRVLNALMTNGKKMDIKQMHKGEADLAVAAASIVARGRFLIELEEMRKKYKVKFPKGASQVVEFGKEFMNGKTLKDLEKVAKISFRTTLKITSTFDI